MKDLNEVDTILGIKIRKHSRSFVLCQSHYIDKVLNIFNHLNIKVANTPYDVSCKLIENTGRSIVQIEYASVIGSLIYVMHCTRLDIAFIVCKLSRYTSNLSKDHWKTITIILGYLKKTHSTMESEFIALATTNKEAEWLRNMLLNIKLWSQLMPSISLYYDCQITMSKAFDKFTIENLDIST